MWACVWSFDLCLGSLNLCWNLRLINSHLFFVGLCSTLRLIIGFIESCRNLCFIIPICFLGFFLSFFLVSVSQVSPLFGCTLNGNRLGLMWCFKKNISASGYWQVEWIITPAASIFIPFAIWVHTNAPLVIIKCSEFGCRNFHVS